VAVAATRRSRAPARAAVVPFPRTHALRVRLWEVLPSAGSILAGLVLAILAVGGYAVARTTSAFEIRSLEVVGAAPELAAEIRTALAPLAGKSLLALDGPELLARVEAIPSVRAATHDRAFPHTLVVSVEPEVPAAVLRRGAESWLVSERGRVLASVERGENPQLPRVWVPAAAEVEAGGFVPGRHALRAVRAAAGAPPGTLPALVRTVRVADGELTFLLASGAELRLGDERELALKLAVAAHLLPQLSAPPAGGPHYLDVAVPERPVAGRNPQVEE
jgi:cell division protein FtsQ